MNITGGSNLSLFEVQEAADIVASASDEEVNMIFGSVINENLKDEIIVTVIATGFTEEALQQQRGSVRPALNTNRQAAPQQQAPIREQRQEVHVQQEQPRQNHQNYAQDDMLEVPAFYVIVKSGITKKL